jgi:hypothetical protein
MVKGTYKAQSSCTFRYPFSMKATIAGSAHNPCTNRPCAQCENSIIWSYSLRLNYSQKYEGLSCPINVDLEEIEKVSNE